MADLTPDDLAHLRVPLSALPGLDPVGLRLRAGEGAMMAYDPAIYVALSGGVMVFDWSHDGTPDLAMLAHAFVCLDHPEGADRVARWLAARVRLEVGCTAPLWSVCSLGWASIGWALTQRDAEGETVCRTFASRYHGGDIDALAPISDATALASESGSRRLPDGSRYVDRLALALVAVHFGSQP